MARLARVLFLAAVVIALFQNGSAQTTEFTYQGQLTNSSALANGNFDFEFALFDGGGTQIGSTLTRSGVPVTNGVFTVNLDFGSSFPGANRFLEVRVRQAGGGAFTTLSPRQPLTSTPYAIKSLAADTALNASIASTATFATNATNATNAGNATTLGNVPASQYLQTNGSGAGLTSLNASSISTGTLANARLGQIPTANIADNAVTAAKIAGGQVVKSINSLQDNVTISAGAGISVTPSGSTLTIASTAGNPVLNQTTLQAGANFNIAGTGTANILNAATQFNIDGSRVLFTPGPGSGNVVVGTIAGTTTASGNNNTILGNSAGNLVSTGTRNTILGAQADLLADGLTNATAIGFRARADVSNSLILGGIAGINAGIDTNVGIGTSAPTSKLEVRNGTVLNSGSSAGGFVVNNPNNQSASVRFDWHNDIARIRYGGNGVGATNGFVIQGPGDAVRLKIYNDGLVQVGSPGELTSDLSVFGRIFLKDIGDGGSGNLCYNTSLGPSFNAISFCSSSRRYKTDVRPFTPGSELAKRLNPVSFTWKGNGQPDLGLVAEEVAEIEPLLVTYNKHGEVEGVKYDRVGVVLLNAFNEQQRQIDDQKRTISAQQAQIDELKALVCSMQATRPKACEK
jgi:hypothetical protein